MINKNKKIEVGEKILSQFFYKVFHMLYTKCGKIRKYKKHKMKKLEKKRLREKKRRTKIKNKTFLFFYHITCYVKILLKNN